MTDKNTDLNPQRPEVDINYRFGLLEATLNGMRRDLSYERTENAKMRAELINLPDRIRARLMEDLQEVKEKSSSNSRRIADLEKWRWVSVGAVTAFLFAWEVLPTILLTLTGKT